MVIVFNYNINKLIGKGSYCFVYSAKDILNKDNKENEYAIKVAKVTKLNDQIMSRLRSEVDILTKISHPNIIKIHNSFYHESVMYIVLEKCKIDLEQYVKNNNPSYEQKIIWIKELVNCLIFLHSKKIIHRDLKPKNILLTETNNLKIIDFGFAKFIDSEDSTQICGTPLYMSPELFTGSNTYGYKTDYWSMGIILYFIITGFVPFGVKNISELMFKIKNITDIKVPSNIANNYDINVINLIESMLIICAKHRISYEQLIVHPFNKKPYLKLNIDENKSFENLMDLNFNEMLYSPHNQSYDINSDSEYLVSSNDDYENKNDINSSYAQNIQEININDSAQFVSKSINTNTNPILINSPIKSPKKDLNYFGHYDDNITNNENKEIFLSSRVCYSAPLNDNKSFLTDEFMLKTKIKK